MSLASNVRILTQPHVAYSPAKKIVTAKPLLTQLTEADNGGGRPTTNERPVPVHLTAIALWQDLEHEAQQHRYEMTEDDSGGLWAIIESWAHVEDDEWKKFLEHVTLDWIDRITNVIEPPRPRRPLMQPCSACGEKYTPGKDGKRIPAVTAWVWDGLGEQVAKPDTWEVRCDSCGSQWTGKEVVKQYWRALR